jgi:ribosomal protein S27AE
MMQPRLEAVTWDSVRQDVIKLNPELADIIDAINPGKKYKLYKAIYNYGELIVDEGIYQLPSAKGEMLPLNHPKIDRQISKSLNYSPIPLSLALNKKNEVFIQDDTRPLPLNSINPGQFFGTFESMDRFFDRFSNPIWSVSAGAKTILMLPRITEANGFKRLRASFSISSSARLKYAGDHHDIFKQLAADTAFPEQWESHVLIFSKEWFEDSLQNPNLLKFLHYIMNKAWHQAQFAIDSFKITFFWQQFVKAIARRNLKPTQYLSDTLRHLIMVASGRYPGFSVASRNGLAAPVQGLQQVFIDTYLLKSYFPTLLFSEMIFNVDHNQPVYYSLAFPTLIEGSPEEKQTDTIMQLLKQIKMMIETVTRAPCDESSITKRAIFNYYHVEDDRLSEIESSRNIICSDGSFLADQTYYKDRCFCATSLFFRGTIAIRLSKL